MKKAFKVGSLDLAVRDPSAEERTKAKIEYNKAVRKAIETGHIMRARLDGYIKDQGLWTDEMEKEDKELLERVNQAMKRLNAGDMKLSQARELALQIKKDRVELIRHRSVKNELDNITAEAFGEQAQFDYLVSVCTVYNETGEPYFKGLEDYKNRSTEDASYEAATHLATNLYNLQAYEDSLPENKFLKKFKFVDDKLRLINKAGHLIDEEGRLINEDGRFVNEAGEFVNIHGERVDSDGELIVESKPFLDDDGNPIDGPIEITDKPVTIEVKLNEPVGD